METVSISTAFIKLQDFLKLAGAVDTGGEAKVEIQAGQVRVNGEACLQRGRKLRPGDSVSFRGARYAVGQDAASDSGAGHTGHTSYTGHAG